MLIRFNIPYEHVVQTPLTDGNKVVFRLQAAQSIGQAVYQLTL